MREDGLALYLLSGGGDRSDWVHNLRSNPAVTVRIGTRTAPEQEGTARPVEGPAEQALARRLLAAKYQGWREGQTLSRWARTALPVTLRPKPA